MKWAARSPRRAGIYPWKPSDTEDWVLVFVGYIDASKPLSRRLSPTPNPRKDGTEWGALRCCLHDDGVLSTDSPAPKDLPGLWAHSSVTSAVCNKIRTAFPDDNPCGHLFYSIVAQAITDLSSADKEDGRRVSESAAEYLNGEILHAEMAGVDSEWIRGLCRKAGLLT